MPSKTVAIVSPGDMGHNVGKALKKEGIRIVTCPEPFTLIVFGMSLFGSTSGSSALPVNSTRIVFGAKPVCTPTRSS